MEGRGHAASEGSSEKALRHVDREGGAPSAASVSPAQWEKNNRRKETDMKKKPPGSEEGTSPGGGLVTPAEAEASKSVLHGVRDIS